VRSLVVRRGVEEDPGTRLAESQAPEVWALAREVAAKIGTRPVDTIFLTPDTELAVSERGSLSARMRDQGHRFLILGVGVLDGMTRRQLSAILAHEYGHFSNRDTAGGDVAGAVRASLIKAIVGIAQGGGAVAINPAWHFLRVYMALFQRVALGASRLQEALADRFAARAYGGPAFVEGLRHVVERSVRFDHAVSTIVDRAEQQRKAIPNLYEPPAEPAGEGAGTPADVENAIAAALAAPGSAYDSHPPIPKRIAWVAAFEDVPAQGADGPAWELFPDRLAIERRMTAIVNGRLFEAGRIEEDSAPADRAPGAPAA
jgi:Zn-dependent protease with chaperone function